MKNQIVNNKNKYIRYDHCQSKCTLTHIIITYNSYINYYSNVLCRPQNIINSNVHVHEINISTKLI